MCSNRQQQTKQHFHPDYYLLRKKLSSSILSIGQQVYHGVNQYLYVHPVENLHKHRQS